MSPAVARVLDALQQNGCKPVKNGTGWKFRCPVHGDKTPSGSLGEGEDGRALLNCFAGCGAKAIAEGVGLAVSDLFEVKTERKIVATYDYQDEAGALLYQAVRYVPKDFRQRRPDGKGDWIWNMAKARLVLYRLPAVLETVENGGTVYIVEGEKDADAINALEGSGFVATCNVGGAGKWRADYGEALRGATVVVIADKDEPGRKHALDVQHHLRGIAASLRVVEAKTGKDAADHLAAGHTLDELVPIETAGRVQLIPATFKDITNPEALKEPWLIEGFIPANGLTLIAAHYKTGKTFLTYRLILDALFSTIALGSFPIPRPLKVQLWQFEMPLDVNLRRFHKLARGMQIDPLEIYKAEKAGRFQAFIQPEISLSNEDDLGQFHDAVTSFGPDILIVDSLSEAFTDEDFKSSTDVRRMLRRAFKPVASGGRGVFALHHKRKAPATGKADDSKGAILGSQAFGAAARTIYTLDRVTDDKPDQKGRFVVDLAPQGGWDIEGSGTTFVVEDSADGKETVVTPVNPKTAKLSKVSGVELAGLKFAELVRNRFRVGRHEAIEAVRKELGCGRTTALDGLRFAGERRWVRAVKTEDSSTNEKTLVSGDHTDWEDLV